MSRIRAAGVVLWRLRSGGQVEVALVHRPRYDDWSLPKGKLDSGETIPEAAAREVTEETGYTAVLGRFLGQSEYTVGSAKRPQPKTVDYFGARVSGGEFRANDEVDDLQWLSPEDARAWVSYAHDARILGEFAALPAVARTLLLVRHAKAGKRQEWTGDDDLRPLSPAGAEQAAALRRLLRLFGPGAVLSAPRLRCVQTVQGAAEDLGTEVRMEPMLAEENYWDDPHAGLRRLLDIVRQYDAPVVSSQGGVIPDVVRALTERYGITVPRIVAKKGSVWLLSFTGEDGSATDSGEPKLLAADYFPTALPLPPGTGST